MIAVGHRAQNDGSTQSREGITPHWRRALIRVTSPRLALRAVRSTNAIDPEDSPSEPDIDWRLTFESDHQDFDYHELRNEPRWQRACRILVPDLQMQLLDALDLLHEADAEPRNRDYSNMELPSIEPHHQNQFAKG